MSEYSQTISPLIVIRDKERAVAQEIAAAQVRANTLIAQARARADAIKIQAEQDGLREAEALYQEGLERACREATELRARGEADAAALLQTGYAQIQSATEHIVQFVLPQNRIK